VAALNGRGAAVRMLIALAANAWAEDDQGATPLHLAGRPWQGQQRTIETLLEVGVPVDIVDRGGSTPLHYAARFGNSPAIKALLAAGADAGVVDAAGETPLVRWGAGSRRGRQQCGWWVRLQIAVPLAGGWITHSWAALASCSLLLWILPA